MDVHLCSPSGITTRHRAHCTTCKATRFMVSSTFIWYGPITMCMMCGTEWNDGRLFAPKTERGRAKALARAYAMESRAVNGGKKAIRAWLRAELELYRTDDAQQPPPAEADGG